MISLNLCLTTFLSLKNTPLAFLTPYSYERINLLHQAAGGMTLFWIVIHVFAWLGTFAAHQRPSQLHRRGADLRHHRGHQYSPPGLLRGVAPPCIIRAFLRDPYLVLPLGHRHGGLASAILRLQDGHGHDFHRSTMGGGQAGSRLPIPRLQREQYGYSSSLSRMAEPGLCSPSPLGAAPGKHLFLWIPGLRAFQMHPFSIVATQPLELVVNSYNGFTKSLHKKAREQPGIAMRASVEGPYGTFPDPSEYDKIVLVAGGSGGSFTFGIAVNALERMTEDSKQEIDFVWAVRETGMSTTALLPHLPAA